ncbi:MAG: response regulator transcription factor [Clostridia bacterium]|nr:response regulator transcription factor [Clostridia bacterium]MBQ2434320.1 response regulator transcription factor [Clostridia bacterium]MBQ5771080.1 response regulator transcription factor [Clostridia bacterium]
MRILFAEDDVSIRSSVAKMLKERTYAVDETDNGRDALDYLLTTKYDLAILDIMMPEMDGLTVAVRAREEGSRTPIIFLTAKDALEDRISGLYAGADDYITKPFAFEELLARVHVVMRRSGANAGTDKITVSDLTVDTRGKKAVRAGREIALTGREYAILEYMIRNAGAVLSREQIQNGVWGYDYEGVSNMIDVYIRNLRKKLDDGFEKKLIHTVRLMGYVLREEA